MNGIYGNLNTPEARTYRVAKSLEAAASRLYDLVTSGGLIAALKKLFGGGKERQLFTLDEVKRQVRIEDERYVGEMSIPLDQVLGTVEEGRSQDFDIDFRPLKAHNKERWLGVAAAWISGRRLGRVKLVQVGDIYFVEDGHHRISVARAMGEQRIEAEVVQLFGTGSLTLPAGKAGVVKGRRGALRPATA